MNREDKMMAHFESVTNIRYTNTDKALMTAAMGWADSHPINRWHKVEDELPPVDKYRGIGYFSIETLFTDGKYMFVGIYSFKSKMWIDRDYWFSTGRITHWMELPELPKDKI